MNAPGFVPGWTEANQAFLVAEFAWLKALLGGDSCDAAQAEIERRRAELASPAAIDQLSERLGLSGFERDLLLLAAGVEMDGALALLCAQGGGRPAGATFGMALAGLPQPHWSALTPMRPLRRWRLLEPEEGVGLVGARLRIDERVLHFIAGVNGLDARLRPLLRAVDEPAVLAEGQRATAAAIVKTLAQRPDAPVPLIQLWGDDAQGQRDVAARVAGQLGLNLHALGVADIPPSPQDVDAFVTLWDREVALSDAALLVEIGAASLPAGLRGLVEGSGGMVLCAAREPIEVGRDDLRQRVDKPDGGDRLRLWREALGDRPDAAALADIGAAFRLSAHDVRQLGARLPDPGSAGDLAHRLHAGCRARTCRRLEGLAQPVRPAACWDDLVLPEAPSRALRRIVSQVRHRGTVLERWGFAARSARGLGLAVLFAGDSGTGKTMAAEVLAGELDLDLFRIDLASVVSKYIGETEKNLARVFDAAEDGGAILLFDEADALFGKRSEVKDSHDRYANIEVSYLLQRMEAYQGLAILSTNQKTALDPAFQRRLRLIVDFPFPDAAGREEIWRRIFPAATPTAGLDPARLARLQMSGGQIRNIALDAAFRAAEAGEAVGMAHLLKAAHAEAAKRERPISESETRGWV